MPVVELERVSKRFGPTHALEDVSLALEAGEVHVIAGENGAGKSTLIRILAGVYDDYQGTLRIDGETVRLSSPADARRAGIATIHQELSLVGPMSIEDNLSLADQGGMFNWSRRRDVRGLLAPLGIDVDPSTPIDKLPLSVRQRIEIARALAQRARVLVMDEPTSALSEPEADTLFEHLKDLRSRGHAIVFITHRMEEIYRIADRISVLRDGRLVASAPATEFRAEALIEAMIGRALAKGSGERGDAHEVVLEARNVSVASAARRILDRVSLALHRGEVLGVAGLQGSGASTLPHALFGAVRASLELSLLGASLKPTPASCVRRGMLLVSGDRSKSIVPELSVVDNAALSSFSPGWIREPAVRAAVQEVTAKLTVRYPALDAPLRMLSGGNQQKVALARALLCRPRVLLLDEPTRGIDVGAKRDVYALVRELASNGVAVLLVSSETDELLELCHRILVLARGRLVRTLARAEFSREAIVSAAMGEVA